MNTIMNRQKIFLGLIHVLLVLPLLAQVQDKEALKEAELALKESKNLTYEGNEQLTANNFVTAEADYRKAISKSKENITAPYNLGRAYYNRESYNEAFGRFKAAGEKATEKTDKHKSYHNLGNVFMKNKEYAKAVEAYKQALRANPDDDETRYNLALAKKKQEENKNDDKNDQNQDQDNKDNKDDQNKNQDQNKNEGDSDQKDEGDQKDNKGNEGDKGKEKPEESKEGEGDEKKEQEEQDKQRPNNKSEEKDEQRKTPRPNQLSKQQIQNLLEAMQNEEKKVQEKMNAQKVKGKKIKNEKDW